MNHLKSVNLKDGSSIITHDSSPKHNATSISSTTTTTATKPAINGSTDSNGAEKKPKVPPKPKALSKAAATGQRFQCPRCPKNFSRIENLTRHQANHEEIGKFACGVCRKRFTRSDLLNRHRRIHNATSQSDESIAHVTQSEYPSTSPTHQQPQPQRFEKDLQNGDRRPSPQDTKPLAANGHPKPIITTHSPPNAILNGRSNSAISSAHTNSSVSNGSPNDIYHEQHQGLYIDHTTAGYQNILSHEGLNVAHQPLLQGPVQTSGLNSLIEAALAPPETYDFSFTPAENFNRSLWGGFMLYGDNTNSYMGTYDADISWGMNTFGVEYPPAYEAVLGSGDFPGDPYHYVPYQKIEVHPIDAADAEDEETNDWPDKTGRSDAQPSTVRRAPRVVPLHLIPVSWQPILDEQRGTGLSAETIRPFQNINDTLRDSLLTALDGTHLGRTEMSRPEIADSIFPDAQVLDFFLRLYVRFVHPRFPVVHLPTFDVYNTPPLLLLAMMFLGSGHSRMDRGRFSRMFFDHLRIAVSRQQEIDEKYFRSSDNILTYFLLCLCGTWSGHKQAYEFAEGGRGILITALRRLRLLDCRPSAKVDAERFQREGLSPVEASWMAWKETEKKRRLGLSIYMFDCHFPAFFNNQPYISKAETTNCVFPCPEEYWESPTAEDWRMLVGTADTPPSTYYLHALNACLFRKWVKPRSPVAKIGGELGKIFLLYALHSHIFEWRQSASMVNPSGLLGTFGATTLPIGERLKERRQWLVDGLDSWGECYLTPNTTVSATLLHKLAYISLDVSLSDMHLVAGRSLNTSDGDFAEENLKHWANSPMSTSTMAHVFSMLDLCHSTVNSGTVPDSSFEVAVCLFTGGIMCWAYAKLKMDVLVEEYVQHMRNAAAALAEMGCWRMCCMFSRILKSFEALNRSGGKK